MSKELVTWYDGELRPPTEETLDSPKFNFPKEDVGRSSLEHLKHQHIPDPSFI